MIYVLSGRMFNPGESPTDIRRRELTARVNQPLLGCYKIAMLSLKGGVGKTTMTATLGATFASLRGDRVVAVDANPDRGTLSQKIPLETSATVRNLLRDAQRVRRYTDVRAYTSQGPSRLEVLASEQDPAVSEAFSEDDYRRTVNLLEHFYNIVLTDCGTGLMHSAMYGVLGVADQLVIVSSGSIDGARSASATMDWLDAHGHGDLVANAVVVINFVHRSRGGVDLDRVSEHFAARCRAVVRIPFDAHLEEGAEIDLDRLEPGTRLALLDLAANVADAFERAHSAVGHRPSSPGHDGVARSRVVRARTAAIGGGVVGAASRQRGGRAKRPVGAGAEVRRAGLPDGGRARRADAGTRGRRPARSPGDGSGRGAGPGGLSGTFALCGVHRLPQHQGDDCGADERDEEQQHPRPPPPWRVAQRARCWVSVRRIPPGSVNPLDAWPRS